MEGMVVCKSDNIDIKLTWPGIIFFESIIPIFNIELIVRYYEHIINYTNKDDLIKSHPALAKEILSHWDEIDPEYLRE